jgi:hypothetical protein
MSEVQETCSWPVRGGARHYRHHGRAGCGVAAVDGPAGSPRDEWRSGTAASERKLRPCLQFARYGRSCVSSTAPAKTQQRDC